MQIPIIILNIAYILPMVVNMLLMMANVYISISAGGGLKSISSAIYLETGTSSAVFIYVCFAAKMNLIILLIDRIQSIAHDRMYKINIIGATQIFRQSTPFVLGFKKSSLAEEIYEKSEFQNQDFIQKILYFVYYVDVTTCVFPALFPIGYLIFGFPKPSMWYFPFPLTFVSFIIF